MKGHKGPYNPFQGILYKGKKSCGRCAGIVRSLEPNYAVVAAQSCGRCRLIVLLDDRRSCRECGVTKHTHFLHNIHHWVFLHIRDDVEASARHRHRLPQSDSLVRGHSHKLPSPKLKQSLSLQAEQEQWYDGCRRPRFQSDKRHEPFRPV